MGLIVIGQKSRAFYLQTIMPSWLNLGFNLRDFPEIHISHFPRMGYKIWRFGYDWLIFKGNSLEEQLEYRLPLEGSS